MRISSAAKAVVSALAAGAAAAVQAITDGNLDASDGVIIALAVLGAYGITYAVPNKPSV